MKFRSIVKIIALFLLLVYIGFSWARDQVQPTDTAAAPGTQTAQSIELPQSGQTWNLQTGPKDLLSDSGLKADETESLSYLLFLPKNESRKTENGYPLILFLHGMGERGSNPVNVARIGLPSLLKKSAVAQEFPFIVVSPQCPDGKCWSAKQLSLFLDKIVEKYPVDKSRIYLTGLSMGGFGTWSLLSERPDAFAVAIPICGGCDPKNAPKLVNTPIWAFHGDCDPVVPAAMTKKITEAIRQAGGEKVKQTLLIQVQHNAWDYVYCNPEVYDWLLSFTKQQKDKE